MKHVEQSKLLQYRDGRLKPDETASIDLHLDECEECFERWCELFDPAEVADGLLGLVDSYDMRWELVGHYFESLGDEAKYILKSDGHPIYRIVEPLAAGGMGVVYRAHDEKLDRPVAIKVLAPLTTSGMDIDVIRTVPKSIRMRFEREHVLAKLPLNHFVAVYDSGELIDQGRPSLPYIVMECLSGTLEDKLNETGPLELAEAIRIGRHLAKGISVLHEAEVIHRDLKPSNILFRDDAPLIGDLGIAVTVDGAERLTSMGVRLGTPSFQSPEQLRGEPIAFASDIYSFGRLLLAICIGCSPTSRHTKSVVGKLVEHSALVDLIFNLLAEDPDSRPLAHKVTELLDECGADVVVPSKCLNTTRKAGFANTYKRFSDRRGQLFGRSPDIAYLHNRICSPGLTAIRARPKMGKTWLVQELARAVGETGEYIGGYHECRGATHDSLEMAIVDLYSRWLSDEKECNRVRAAWNRYKPNYLPDVANALSSALDVTDSRAPSIKDAIRAVAGEKQGQGSAGIGAGLRYEHLAELVLVVSDLSQKRVLLIVDAWEQSISQDSEARLFAAFLANLQEWSTCHVIVTLRPDHDVASVVDELASSSPSGAVLDLPPMHLDDGGTSDEMVEYVQQNVPAARDVDAKSLLSMVNAFPGVLSNWLSSHCQDSMTSVHDLQLEASAAHEYRYREFNDLLPALQPEERSLAIRVALTPGIEEERWQYYKKPLLATIPESTIDELFVKRVFEGGEIPSFGHQTRDFAAGRWFLQHEEYKPAVKRELEGLIHRFSCGFDRVDDRSIVACVTTVAGFYYGAQSLQLSEDANVLCIAAQNFIFNEEHEHQIGCSRQDALLPNEIPVLPNLFVWGSCEFNFIGEMKVGWNYATNRSTLYAASVEPCPTNTPYHH